MTLSSESKSRNGRRVLIVACLMLAGGPLRPARAGDIRASQEQFRAGHYAECLESCRKAIESDAYEPRWRVLMIESLLALGRYNEAAVEVAAATRYSPLSIPFLKLAHTAYTQSGQVDRAQDLLTTIYRVASTRRLASMDSQDLVALGETLLLLGGEPRIILEEFYNRALRNDPNYRDGYLAAGDLALAKQDYQLAAGQYRKVIERFGADPDAYCGLAKAFYYSDRAEMMKSLDAAFVVNPRHADALVLLAEHQIDCEDYDGAAGSLAKVMAVNPWHPDAWAYRAVLAHLVNDLNAETNCRANALKFWKTNPRVDYLIGRKLSQKYRFAEGAAYQSRALRFDPAYLPAKGQLAEDLLRLGDQQGWTLADEVYTQDPYNITAYNLVNLRDNMAKFDTIDVDGLVIRMDAHEASVYGDRVARLLDQARSDLCRKYGLELDRTVTVEIFRNQQDFAVRTFGMPGGDGFLGVCFGNVITANSPRAERPANWEATLWHEFAHVVTLNLTNNRMPRWLSEGISVYEELQHNPRWGQRMNPQYRKMILGGELTPVSNLSAAFLNPPTPMHLQFAYYESALVVEFLVERFGFDSLKAILADLGKGEEINAVIAGHTAPLPQIEKQFEAFARKRAESLAPKVDWEQPEKGQIDPTDLQALDEWLTRHPNSFWGLTLQAANLMEDREWEEAKKPLEKLISLYPEYVGESNAYQFLALAHRHLDEIDQERQVLNKMAAVSADAIDAYARLMEISEAGEDWSGVVENGNRYLAVYPMLPTVYWRMGRADEEAGRGDQAVEAYRRLLLLDPADPVEVNYRLAKLLHQRDPATAKRHILEALADAPRFRQGHRLLLQIADSDSPSEAEIEAQRPLSPAQENTP
jgi:tetratricopeptide (TPR) repeat protein